jgi:cob(I)alamin adenosyltransferase
MGNRLTKIYTRTGDDGTTGLGDGSRVAKDDPRVEAYGCADELNSLIGSLLAVPDLPQPIIEVLTDVQHDLFDLGGELCLPGYQCMKQTQVDRLERVLDELNESLPPLKDFILPGGGPGAAAAHVARTVCRRTERRVWTLNRSATVNPLLVTYLNRLSDLLFVVARTLARHERGGDVLWNRDR